MPEFSAGNIWIEVDGKRLPEYGEKIKLETPEQEAKSCFVELPSLHSRCTVNVSFQSGLKAGGAQPDMLLLECTEMSTEGKAIKGSVHRIISLGESASLFKAPHGAFQIEPLAGCTTALRNLLSDQELLGKLSSGNFIFKVLVSPRSVSDTDIIDNVWLRRFMSPADPWQSEQYGDGPRWFRVDGKSGWTHKVDPPLDLKHSRTSACPQLTAVFQVCFPGTSCSPSFLNRDHHAVPPRLLAKTISTYRDELPSLANLAEQSPASQDAEAPSPRATSSKTAKKTDKEECQQYRAENGRLVGLLVASQREVQELKDQIGASRKRQSEDTIALSAKKVRLSVKAGERVEICVEGDDGLKEEKEEGSVKSEEELAVKVKKEPGEDG